MRLKEKKLALDGPLNGEYINGNEAMKYGYRLDDWNGEQAWFHKSGLHVNEEFDPEEKK